MEKFPRNSNESWAACSQLTRFILHSPAWSGDHTGIGCSVGPQASTVRILSLTKGPFHVSNGHFSFLDFFLSFPAILFYNLLMVDTSIHSVIFKFQNPHHLDFIDFDVHHPIRSILFHNYDIIESWDASGRSRPCVLDNVQRSILCNTGTMSRFRTN